VHETVAGVKDGYASPIAVVAASLAVRGRSPVLVAAGWVSD
jgi:hypothetical protein